MKEEEEEGTLEGLLHPFFAVSGQPLVDAAEAGSRCPVAERQDGG